MGGDLAKSMLQAIMASAERRVGSFVDLRELTAKSAFGNARAAATMDELLARGWIYRKGDYVAVSRPGVEYAIDWALARRVLQAINTAAHSQGGRVSSYRQIVETAGLPAGKTDELIAELSVLDLAANTASDGLRIDGAYITREGLSRLASSAAIA